MWSGGRTAAALALLGNMNKSVRMAVLAAVTRYGFLAIERPVAPAPWVLALCKEQEQGQAIAFSLVQK